MATRRTVIPFPDYERIFGLIVSVLEGRARTAHACVFFALTGAAIPEQKYKIEATPRTGAAAYVVDDHTVRRAHSFSAASRTKH